MARQASPMKQTRTRHSQAYKDEARARMYASASLLLIATFFSRTAIFNPLFAVFRRFS